VAAKDDEIDNLVAQSWSELPSHYRRAVLRRAKSDLWWQEAMKKLEKHQALFVVLVGLIGIGGIFREYVSEAAQWIADALGEKDK
jgi:hypothetical protein